MLVLAIPASRLIPPEQVESPGVAVKDMSPTSYIVRATSTDLAEQLVRDAGGMVLARLEIINAVGAILDESHLADLRADSDIIGIYQNARLEVLGGAPRTHYPAQVGAHQLHRQGLTGRGATIAVLDTGLWQSPAIAKRPNGEYRIVATHDSTEDDWSWLFDACDDDDDDCNQEDIDDWNGHGTHVTSIMVSSARSDDGNFQGIAPDARIVAVRAFEPDGSGTYLNVLKALNWIVTHRKIYEIDILNLSFGAPAASHYWNDPVNLAVMEAWRQGITVVASAGNGGPGPMTVGVPANVPYIITVGAYTDNYTPDIDTDDRLTTFSAAGPTAEGFVKPDLLAPGGHMRGVMPPYAWLPLQYPEHVQKAGESFTMSGTSQAAAVVSGVVALMLEANPDLQPDDIKCRLMGTARSAMKPNSESAYSVFQQGAGKVHAPDAAAATFSGCANRGLKVKDDLYKGEHFAGPAGIDVDGTFYVVDKEGNRLTGTRFEWTQGAMWPEGTYWSAGQLWTEGLPWSPGVHSDSASSLNPDSLMIDGAMWPEGSMWPESSVRPLATYLWVEQQ